LEPQNLEEAAEPGAMESAQKPDEPTAIEKMNCLEIKVMFGDEEQEVEASYLVTWAYGFRTGATGMDFEKHPLTEEGFAAFVAHLMEVCSSDSEKLFVEAILE
jgi:hypothetical protein